MPLVRQRSGIEAIEGKVLHWMSATRFVDRLGASAPAGGLPRPTGIPDGYTLKSNASWIVDWYFNLVKHLVPASWSLEVELELEHEFDSWILEGHLDTAATSPENARYAESDDSDLKTGVDPVLPAEFNEQVNGYMVLRACVDDVQKARFRIAQPRIADDEEDGTERVSTVEKEGAELYRMVEVLDERVCDALSDSNLINSGRTQCKWCNVGIQCPSIQKEIEYLKTLLTPEILAQIRAEADDALLGDLIISGKIVERPLKDALELLKARLEAAGALTAGCGTVISQKVEGGKYKVLDPVKMLEELLDMVDVDRLAPALQYSRGRIEDAIAAQFDIPKSGGEEQTAEMIFDARLGPYVEQTKRSKLIFQ
jgi:hypothetical protein